MNRFSEVAAHGVAEEVFEIDRRRFLRVGAERGRRQVGEPRHEAEPQRHEARVQGAPLEGHVAVGVGHRDVRPHGPHGARLAFGDPRRIGLWGGSFGFKLVVLKLESKDSPEKIAAFYQKALTKYGKVLNCSSADSHSDTKDKKNSSNQITCDDDKPDTGGTLFKAGTKDKQHLVEIKPSANGVTVFTLLHIETRGTEDKEAL